MITEIGNLKRHDEFIFQNEKYKILGIGNRSYNNVKCQNIKTNICAISIYLVVIGLEVEK